ncbi:DUF6086 family protein [Streptomyces sp. NPDC056405]|uniref:DUF6086 family protein n=1 Tax=Streptomyces sp. NPDC056405 TaxID=3345811 RepID=UPI0035D57EB8
MGYSFEIDGKDIWSPSRQVGHLFVGMVETMAAVVSRPDGLGPNMGEMYEIDLPEFQALVQEVLKFRASNSHRYLVMMVDGVLPIMIAMIERAGHPVHARSDKETAYLSWVREQQLPMNKVD